MRDYLNLSKPLTQLSLSSSPPLSLPSPPPPPPGPPKTNMPMLYYGLVVVATAAIILAIYNLIIVRWCATQYRRSREANQLSGRRRNINRNIMLSTSALPPPSLSRGGSTVSLMSSFRYKKAIKDDNNKTDEFDYDIECSVCLSVFEDGEEVTRLPRCNHSFHASCIDMWLYSHSDCPLCRAPVAPQPPPPQHRHTESEHSRDGLLDTAGSSV